MEQDNTVSLATIKNWKRLNTQTDGRLTSRANKRKSKKRIIPSEYFCNLNNVKIVEEILNRADEMLWSIPSVILSLGINQLKYYNIFYKDYIQKVLDEYSYIQTIEELININLPRDEIDFMGLVYQSFLNEGQKNIIGSYYTPYKITENMTKNFDFSDGQLFLDPCCGSGAFLLAVHANNPEQLYGVDNDKIAVMIAKINLLLKYPDVEFMPQIYCLDFLQENSFFGYNDIFLKKFDYIATNPPWGAITNHYDNFNSIISNETFSYFFVKAFEQLKEKGIIRFLFPESFLNVKVHKDIRHFILNNGCIKSITIYDNIFSGVITKCIELECINKKQQSTFIFYDKNNIRYIDISSVYETENLVFNLLNEEDISIIQNAKSKGKYFLKQSIWALGIVTGNNKEKLSQNSKCGMEKIYTGKEICPYVLKPAQNYLLYDRKNLQQVAKEEIYRAPEKLVYKFISNKLIFAYDDTKSLFLNSANILIPQIPNMTIKTVLAFLNSDLFQFLYIKMFGEVKILKGNLMELPFPDISSEQNLRITSKVNALLQGDKLKESEIQEEIFSIYDLTSEQILYIKEVVHGKVD